MISEELAKQIKDKEVSNVNIIATVEDISRPCAEFDEKVSSLCRDLRLKIKEIDFNFNFSAENYKIVFPEKISEKEIDELIKIFQNTTLLIKEKYGFGVL